MIEETLSARVEKLFEQKDKLERQLSDENLRTSDKTHICKHLNSSIAQLRRLGIDPNLKGFHRIHKIGCMAADEEGLNAPPNLNPAP